MHLILLLSKICTLVEDVFPKMQTVSLAILVSRMAVSNLLVNPKLSPSTITAVPPSIGPESGVAVCKAEIK